MPPKEQVYTEVFAVKISPKLLKAIRVEAKRAGVSVAEWARTQLGLAAGLVAYLPSPERK